VPASEQSDIRVDALTRLLELTPPVQNTIEAATELPRDQTYDLVTLTPGHVRSALERLLYGDVTGDEIEAWAEALHGRDDVALEEAHRDLLADFLYRSSTPELFGALTPSHAREWLNRLETI
jgi:hypothetical protein